MNGYSSRATGRVAVVLLLGLAWLIGSPAQAAPIDPGAGFIANTLAGNDDGSTGLVNIGFPVNFFGTTYTQLYVNNNGNVTFTSPLGTFTPFGLTTPLVSPIIAPFFADVDTRTGNTTKYGNDNVTTPLDAGRPAFGVTWLNVGYYSTHLDKLNSFQLLLIDRSDTGAGNFDIRFNYERIQWETGDASGGSGGLGGSSAAVGYSNGTGTPGTFFEFPGSHINGAFLDGNALTSLVGHSNVGINGEYIFQVRNGQVLAPEVPEPASLLVFGVVSLGAAGYAIRRRRSQRATT